MEIPQTGFGTYRLKDDTFNSVIYALKNGYSHIDTAPLYKNEEPVGKAIVNSGIERKKIFVTTKVSRNELKDNKIQESIENSFKTMNLDYIDLVLLHEPIDVKKNWDLLSTYYNTVGKNKIKFIGVSNFNPEHFKEISFNTKPYCNQIELNPFLLRNPVVEYCNQNEIKIVAHSPLAKGEKLNYKKLVDFSKKYNASPAQIMLQWNLQQNNGVIPRSKEFNHIQQNINCNFKLEEEDVKYLNTFDCKFSTHPKYL